VRGAVTVRASSDMRTPDGHLHNTDNRAAATELAAGVRRGAASLQARYAGRVERIEIYDDPAVAPGYTGFQRIRTDRGSVELRAPVGAARLQMNVGYEENLRREYASALAATPDLGLHVANWTGFAHLDHAIGATVTGTLGVSGLTSRFTNRGSRTLIPSSDTRGAAVYLFEQASLGRWRLTAGARYDRRSLSTGGHEGIGIAAQSRGFDAFTGSMGALYRLTDDVSVVASTARGFRAPAAPDLFANGFHEGTRAYERGNPNLRVETSLNTDLGVRVARADLTGELTGFVNRVSDYIYLRPFGTGGRAYDSLQVEQGDARLAGVEGRVAYRPLRLVTLQLSGDWVRGHNTTADVPLTFIPPLRVIYGARIESPHGSAGTPPPYLSFTVETNARQTRLDPRDTSPPGYSLATVGAGMTRLVPRGAATIDLTVRNLFDVRYRSFMSRYKDYALGPGRSVVLRAAVPF
jgi:outer membrane receptor protein involved in Fe transport